MDLNLLDGCAAPVGTAPRPAFASCLAGPIYIQPRKGTTLADDQYTVCSGQKDLMLPWASVFSAASNPVKLRLCITE